MTQTPARPARRGPASRPEPTLPKRGELPVDSWAWLHELTEEQQQREASSDEQ